MRLLCGRRVVLFPALRRGYFTAAALGAFFFAGTARGQESALPAMASIDARDRAPYVESGAVDEEEVRAQWARSACARSADDPEAAAAGKIILVHKSFRALALCSEGRELKHYQPGLGFWPFGPKTSHLDGRTPEGRYHVVEKGFQFHRDLRLDYPNGEDKARAKKEGVSPGSGVLIHGLSANQRAKGPEHVRDDWTAGCIALSDEEIEEVWNFADKGTPVVIEP